MKFAEAEYDNLTHEDGANENLDDGYVGLSIRIINNRFDCFLVIRNYDDDFDDDDDGIDGPTIDQSTNKRMGVGGSVVSPPQRIGSTLKTNDIDERWKD